MLLLVLSTYLGMLMNYLFVFMIAAVFITLMTVGIAVAKKQVNRKLSEIDLRPRTYALQGLLGNTTWITIGVCIHIAVIPIQFSPSYYAALDVIIWGAVSILCLLDWVPRKQKTQSINIIFSFFLIFLIYQLCLIYLPTQSSNVSLVSPLKGDFYVLHGGNSVLINHHHFVGSQKYAMDIILSSDGGLPLRQETDLQKYQTFGKAVFAPVDGVIVALENSLPDQYIGKTDRKHPAGNHIVLKTEIGIFILMAHLKKHSVLIEKGDRVIAGQELAKIGNSGNTTQPHLHIQAMTGLNFLSKESKGVPMSFGNSDTSPKLYKRNDVMLGLPG